jgi:hypothetical protein
MPKSCIICRVGASLELQLQYCDQCQSAMYCSRACQRIDWKKQHKKICQFPNVGDGDRQVRTETHTSQFIAFTGAFERNERSLDGHDKQFFQTLPGINVRSKSGCGEKYEEDCQTTDQAETEVSVLSQFVLACAFFQFGDAFVTE